MSRIVSFCANPYTQDDGVGAIQTSWDLSNSLTTTNVQDMYLYLSKKGISTGQSISTPIVVPKTDASSGNLTTSFTVDSNTEGVQFSIEIGETYEVIFQIVYKIGSGPIQADSSSPAKLVLVSSLPPAPNFELDYGAEPTDGSANQILIYLKDASGNEPQPESDFDGYLTLAGAFITYSSGSNLQSVYVANDASNVLYNEPIKVPAVAGNEYEVAVALYNYTIDASCNMTFGGRGSISDSQLIDVENLATAPKNFDVYETMRELSDASAAAFDYVSNTLKWQNPSYFGVSFESFVIYRDGVKVKTITDLSGDSYTYEWVDNNGMTAGTTYTYVIKAVNVDGEGLPATKNMVGVVFPTVADFTAEPATATSAILTITPSPNGFTTSVYDFSYNNAPSDASNNSDVSYNAANLTTNEAYIFEGRVKSTSNTSSLRTYVSEWVDTSAQIFDPVMANPQNFSISAVDPSGLPLDGELKLSWTDSSSTPIVGQMEAVVEQKNGANWNVIITLDASASQSNNHTVSGLNNGQLYEFRVKNTIDNGSQEAASGYAMASGTPFTYPGPVQNLVLDASGETNKLYYSFDAPDVSGGSAVVDYRFVLNNLNDGSSNLVTDVSGITDVSGELTNVVNSLTLDSGTQYQLIVYPRNNGGSVQGSEASAIAFTVPTGFDTPTANNSDASGNFYEYIKLDWDYGTNDASNVTYNIYKNAEAVASFKGITGKTFTDSQTVIGAAYRYQVVPVVNGVEAEYDPSNTPVPSSVVRALRAPDQVDEVRVDAFTIDSLDVSWNASTNNSGQPDTAVIYKIELIDPSGNVADSSSNLSYTTRSYNFIGLTEPYYTVKVYAGVSTLSSPTEHYNNENPAEVTQYLYNDIPVPVATMQPSNTALLANWTNQTDVSGLTFVHYDTELATDASFLNVDDNTSLNTSEYFYTGLVNGTTYYLRVRNVYKTSNNVEIEGDWSVTVNSRPGPAPNQPVGVSAFPEESTQGTADIVRVSWDFPISPDEPSKYAVEHSTDSNNVYDGSFNWIELADLSNNGSKYYTDIAGLTTGKVYYFVVYAGQEVVNVTYVSQPSQVESAVPYTVPSAVRNLDGTSYPNQLVIDWNTPSNTGGAGIGTNGPILYEATLYSDSSFIPANEVDKQSDIPNTTGDIVATFTGLTNNTPYWVRVRAYFDVQGTGNLSYGSYSDLSLNTSNTPTEPGQISILSEGTLGLTTGKKVEISWLVDASFGLNESKVYRTIRDPDDVQLVPKTQIATLTNQLPLNNVLTFVDTDGSLNINPDNFLNGNQMIYDVEVTYNYAQGSIVYNATQSNAAVPYGAPIPTDQSGNPIDLSMVIVPVDEIDGSFTQIDMHINKNGRNLTSLLALGILPAGSLEPTPVLTPDVNTIVYDNQQFNGRMAKDQYSKYRFDFETPVESTFVSESNAAGSLQSSYPPGSFA